MRASFIKFALSTSDLQAVTQTSNVVHVIDSRSSTPVGSVYGVITVVNAKNLRLSCHCFILALLIAVVDFSQTCLLLTYV